MEALAMIPNVLHDKLLNNSDLKDIFSDIPKECYINMLKEVIATLFWKRTLTPELTSRIQNSHKRYKITRKQFQTFVHLFIESAREIGISSDDISHMRTVLYEMDHMFVFTEDELKMQIVTQVSRIINDIDMYSDYKDIRDVLQNIKNSLINKRRSLDLNQSNNK